MARGGYRPGAGRKPGTPGIKGPKPITKARKAIAEKILSDGDLTPLQVMIDAMRAAHQEGRVKDATTYAAMAAPYVHPKLASIDSKVKGEVSATIQIVSEFPDAE